MHWKNQVKQVCSKLAYGCHILLQARECFNFSILRILYFAFIQSQLIYCMESWGNTYPTYLEPVIRLQKRAIRIITYSKYTDSTEPLFKSTGILPFHSMYTLKIAQTIHKILQLNEPLPHSIFITPKRETRAASAKHFNLPACHNTYGQRLLEFNGVLIWNGIPNEVKTETNFVQSLKMFLMNM